MHTVCQYKSTWGAIAAGAPAESNIAFVNNTWVLSIKITYPFNIPFRKGSLCCRVSSWLRPCINVMGRRKMIIKTIEPRSVAMRRIQSCLYGNQRFDQYMSSGSGARLVTHFIGLDVWRISDTINAAYRVLKNTKAAAQSCIRLAQLN
jgi:hypothetical protein